VFLSVGARALRETGGGFAGADHRRVGPARDAGQGAVAAGAFATRALVQAAAQEHRADGFTWLAGGRRDIESPKTAAFTEDQPRDALADMGEVAAAVAFLVGQGVRG